MSAGDAAGEHRGDDGTPDDAQTREVPLLMPKMSMTMEEGEVINWHAAEGDQVSAGDVIAEVMTDKVDMDVEAPVDGVLVRIVADPRSTVPVGEPMAFIRTESDDLMAGLFDDTSEQPDTSVSTVDTAEADDPAVQPASSAAAVDGPAQTATPASRRGSQPAVPYARRRAAELGVPLTSISGSGPDGLITVDDVEQAAQPSAAPRPGEPPTAEPPTAEPPTAEPAQAKKPPADPKAARPETARPGTGDIDPGYADELAARRRSVRAAVARTMTASAQIPQFTVFADLDLRALDRDRGRVGWTALLVRALARALRAHPHAAAGWDDQAGGPGPTPESIGVALAVDSAVGLLAPVLRDPDQRPVADLDAEVRALIDRARTGRLTMADLQGPTTTLSNLGGFDVPSFTSLLTPPQSSALSVGSIGPRPMVLGGGLTVGHGTTVGLTVDHRTIDGADAARLLAELRTLVADPARLLS